MKARMSFLELKTLGTLDLRRSDGTVLQSVLTQPKRAALLIYLVAARPRGMHQRDVLLNLFWGERDEQSARKALRQALYYLRTSLGDDVITTIGDTEVGVASERIKCDAVELVDAFNDGRFEDAWSLYTGELLHGFHVDDAPEFENWLDEERTWLRKRSAEAAWRLASAREAEGDHAATAMWSVRVAALSPADETMLRRLMLSLDCAGDRAAALRAFDDFVRTQRRDYELEPSRETAALADALRTRGTTPVHETVVDARDRPSIVAAVTQLERRVPSTRFEVRPRRMAGVLTASALVLTAIFLAVDEPFLDTN